MSYFPIEKPGKSISFNSSRSLGSSSKKKEGEKDKKSIPPSQGGQESKYYNSLSSIKRKASGNTSPSGGIIKSWSFNRVRTDSGSPELRKYGESLSRLKGSINKKKD
jgi:hypothetical protein